MGNRSTTHRTHSPPAGWAGWVGIAGLTGGALLACALSGCANPAAAPVPEDPISVMQQAEQYIAHLQAVEDRQEPFPSGPETEAGGAFAAASNNADEDPADPEPRGPAKSNSQPAYQTVAAVQAVQPASMAQPSPAPQANHLRLEEAQCQAAQHSPVANALDRQRCDVLRTGQERARLREPANLAAALLQCQAITERNDAAAEAYSLFFRLAELQQQRELLNELERLLGDNERVLATLRNSGLGAKGDPTESERHQLDLKQKRIDLEHGVERIVQALHVRMGNDRLAPIPVVHTELGADRELVDVDAAVAAGVACRSDLGQLRVLMRCVNTSNMETARQLLSLVEPALGAVLKAKCDCFSCLRCLIHCDDCCDLQQLRRQVQELYQGALDLAEVEISSNAIQVNQAIRTLEVAERLVAVWDRRVEQLQKLAKQESSLYEQLAKARAERLQAISDVIHAAAAVDLARGSLLASQGYLAQQCGVAPCCGSECHPPAIGSGDAEGIQWSADGIDAGNLDWSKIKAAPMGPELNQPTTDAASSAPLRSARRLRHRSPANGAIAPTAAGSPSAGPSNSGNGVSTAVTSDPLRPEPAESKPSAEEERQEPIRLDAIGRFRPISVSLP